MDPIADTLSRIMRGYRKALKEAYSKEHAICEAFVQLASLLRSSGPIRNYPTLIVRWSVGKGQWAHVPWLALLDSQHTEKVSNGIYVVFLFRADMSGVYLTLNQGTMAHATRRYSEALVRLRGRTERLRSKCSALAARGFMVGEGIELRSRGHLAVAYEKNVIAHRLFELAHMPADKALVADLGHLLAEYRLLAK